MKKAVILFNLGGPDKLENVVKDVMNYNPEEVILMPLYPQFSAATSGSSIKEWKNICLKNNFETKTSTICCYPTDENFVQAHKDEIIKKINNLDNFKLIFFPYFQRDKQKFLEGIIVQPSMKPRLLNVNF